MSIAKHAKILQKYLLPLENNVEPSAFYATSYLQIKISDSEQIKTIAESVSRTNQILNTKIKRLKSGYYDNTPAQFQVEPCSPLRLDLPYPDLVDMDVDTTTRLCNAVTEGQTLYPSDLDCEAMKPWEFKFIGTNVQTNDFHISLLPIIRFVRLDESIAILRTVRQLIDQTDIINSGSIPVKFDAKLKIYPKYDYSKFFLAVCLDKSENPLLARLIHSLSRLRYNLDSPGHVIGEISDNHIIDWEDSSLHMTIGVCNGTSPSDLVGNFGVKELCYINNVFLNSSGDNLLVKDLNLEGRFVFVMNNQKLVY